MSSLSHGHEVCEPVSTVSTDRVSGDSEGDLFIRTIYRALLSGETVLQAERGSTPFRSSTGESSFHSRLWPNPRRGLRIAR